MLKHAFDQTGHVICWHLYNNTGCNCFVRTPCGMKQPQPLLFSACALGCSKTVALAQPGAKVALPHFAVWRQPTHSVVSCCVLRGRTGSFESKRTHMHGFRTPHFTQAHRSSNGHTSLNESHMCGHAFACKLTHVLPGIKGWINWVKTTSHVTTCTHKPADS